MGTPLKDWDINIYRGVLTGCNEAFIITTEKRNEILENCLTAEEREKTEEIIRPILRGRDIKRYGYQWANLWLIGTFPSKKYNIDDYPAVKNYLLSFGKERLEQTGKVHIIDGMRIKSRKKTNNKWFEVQDSIAYWDLFFKPYICWKAVGKNLAFALVEGGTFLTAPASFISAGEYNNTILLFLRSSVGKYFIYKYSDTTGAGDIMLNIQSLIQFPIPIEKVENENLSESEIDTLVFNSYGLTKSEIRYIKDQLY